ncbi:MAG: transglutaminase family protein [Myxococcota bacterium]
MNLKIEVDHLTEYHYDSPVTFGEHSVYLRPRESQTLRVKRFTLESEPNGKLRWVRDCFNNIVAVFNYGLEQSSTLSVHCRMVFDVSEENPFDFIVESRATEFPFNYDEREKSALSPYLGASEAEREAVGEWLRGTLDGTPCDTVALLTSLNQVVYSGIAYERRDEEGVQTPSETLARRKGSCRDMAELFVAASRQLGFAARFVSGYLYEPTDESSEGSNRAAGSMHAWAEVYLPGAGWRGFDATNGILTDHHFITAAVANRPAWVAPIQGRYFHDETVGSRMHVVLRVEGSET